MADSEGVDGISNPSSADMIAAIDGQKPVDFIEEGLDASAYPADGKWKTASDRFEESLKDETTQDLDYNDDETISEGEAERPAIPDVDDDDLRRDIANSADDYGSIITPAQGNMGATETTTRTAVVDAMAAGASALTAATKQNFDDGEKCAAGTTPAVAELLAQSFPTKKWAISKETNKDFLAEISLVTLSENVKSLADQRLTELE
jgi:hypothetical protein